MSLWDGTKKVIVTVLTHCWRQVGYFMYSTVEHQTDTDLASVQTVESNGTVGEATSQTAGVRSHNHTCNHLVRPHTIIHFTIKV